MTLQVTTLPYSKTDYATMWATKTEVQPMESASGGFMADVVFTNQDGDQVVVMMGGHETKKLVQQLDQARLRYEVPGLRGRHEA
jgi:hypothetical protein